MLLQSVNTNANLILLIQAIVSLGFTIIGFFIARYIKSVDKKLELLVLDINDLNIQTKLIDERQEKGDEEHSEIKIVLDKINNTFDLYKDLINENKEEIIKIKEREKFVKDQLEKALKAS